MAFRLPIRLPAAFVADDDRALLARFAEARDEHAFAAIVGRHARMVYGVCKRAVRDEHLAEDAFQAVFLVLAKNPARAATASSVAGWLFGIARRVGLAARRHEERRQRRETHTRPAGEQSADFDDLMRVLDEELAALPDDCRAALVACFLEERTHDEAAKQLGWSLSTLRRRLDRGKELLRARLTRRGATLAGGLFAVSLAPSARAAVPPKLIAAVATPSPLARTLAAEATRGAVTLKLGLAAVAMVALGGLGFALTENQGPASPGAPLARHEVAPAPRPTPQAAWTTLTGQVVFPEERDVPQLKLVPSGAVKDADFFGQPPVGDVLVEPKTRGLANAVVWLRPDSDDPKATFPADKVPEDEPQDHFVLAGREGFTPRVLAVRAGDTVTFSNPTPIVFNVRYQRLQPADAPMMGGDAVEFNILLRPDRTHATKPLTATRFADLVMDSIHPWVKGYVWVFDHPYFAVTDTNGDFIIPSAPAGAYRLVVWHEKVGYRDGAKGKLGERVAVRGDGKMNLGRVVMSSAAWDAKDE